MRPVRYFLLFPAAIGLTLLVISSVTVHCSDVEASARPEQADGLSARQRFHLPKIFDFELYKRLFKRAYHGVEESARRKYMLARAFRAWISSLKYKYHKSGFYLALNQFSDRSPEELKRRANRDMGAQDGRDPLIEVKQRHKREVTEDQTDNSREFDDEKLISTGEGVTLDPETSQKVDLTPPSNNPDYEAPAVAATDELQSVTWHRLNVADDDNLEGVDQPMPENIFSMIARSWQKMTKKSAKHSGELTKSDEVFFDHRDSHCMLLARDQGDCASCYAFVAISIAEWLYCNRTGKLVAFSEQYMLDCGRPHLNSGCQGGNRFQVAKFIHNYGLELAAHYPYRAAEGECPYAPTVRPQSMGYIRMELGSGTRIPTRLLDQYIANGPMYVAISIEMGALFEYGGGVMDDEVECDEESWHAVTLIGHGREDNKHYWLLRNSHSAGWGEEGHFKLAKRATNRCMPDGFGLMYGTQNGRDIVVEPGPNEHRHYSIEIQLVRGLADASGHLELPCLVDQANCGEVYYITWTRQTPTTAVAANGSSAWTRVYLYTGATDSNPHKPIGDLVNRATFVMPPTASGHSMRADLDDSTREESTLQAPKSAYQQQQQQQMDVGQKPQARLIIEEPRLTDEALYKCDVTYVKGKCPSISLVRVQMLALPSKAQLFQVMSNNKNNWPQQQTAQLEDNQSIGPLNEQDQLQLKCSVTGGRPAPRAVFWRKIDSSGRVVNLKQPVTMPGAKSGVSTSPVEVYLNHTLTNSDLGAKFECHIEHEAMERTLARIVGVGERTSSSSSGVEVASPDAMLDLHPAGQLGVQETAGTPASKSLDSHVIVDLNVGIASLDLFLNKMGDDSKSSSLFSNEISSKRNASEPLVEGDLIEIECVAYNSKPAANITWLNGQDLIGDSGDVVSSTSTTTSTTQSPFSIFGGSSRTQLRWPQRHRRLSQRNQVQLNADGQTFNTHSFLSIKLSRNEHRAQITCQAQNTPMQRPLVRTMELQVQHTPIVLMEPAAGIVTSELIPGTQISNQQQNVIINGQSNRQHSDEVSIYCIYSAYPSQLVVASSPGDQNSSSSSIARWFKDGQPIPSSAIYTGESGPVSVDDHHHHLIESTTATGYPVLTIRRPNRRDAGRYDCQVSNAIGPSERLAASESCKVEVNFRPSVQLGLYRLVDENHLRPGRGARDNYKLDELVEVDLEKELILPGAYLVLICNIVEAQPNKINKFHWYSTPMMATPTPPSSPHLHRLNQAVSGGGKLGVSTESEQFKLSALGANFTATSFACAASNVIGESEQSNQIDLQLSYAPGQSFVRPVTDAMTRKLILASGRPAHSASPSEAGAAATTELIGAASELANKEEQRIRRQQQHQQQQQPPMPHWPQLQRPPQQPMLNAGAELLLECVTQDLGQPRANIWLWFKNGQTIETIPYQPNTNSQHQRQSQQPPPTTSSGSGRLGENLALSSPSLDIGHQDNPISGASQLLSAQEVPTPTATTSNIHIAGQNTRTGRQTVTNGEDDGDQTDSYDTTKARDREAAKDGGQEGNRNNNNQLRARSLASGRYLFIPSIQLAHKGNYSCVAVNRLGSGPSAPNQSSNERDSYQLRVALAPSFVQPLAARTYWYEIQHKPQPANTSSSSAVLATGASSHDNQQLDLVCHVQCEPICQIEWLRNNEPLDLKRQSEGLIGNYVSHQVRQTLIDENDATNMFRGVESRLTLQFHDLRPASVSSSSSHVETSSGHHQSEKLLMMDRERTLERRQLLNGANYTCQSSANSMGPPVKSTTKFIVQYPPENVFINTPSDKLNLVEGSNGPRLSCGASGEPQVQYRWWLLRSNNNVITSSDLVATRYKVKHFNLATASSQRPSPLSDAIHQMANKQQQQIGFGETSALKSPIGPVANDIGPLEPSLGRSVAGEPDSARLVELTGASVEQVGGPGGDGTTARSISTLDLSDISIDRKQAGHYICEASNKLGQTRQSVYVNVLYKPTCTSLHLYSLDMIQTPPAPADGGSPSVGTTRNNNHHDDAMIQQTPVRPFKATNNDEYSMVHETSQDFIGLRKILIMSPMLNRHPQQQQQQQLINAANDDELSFRGSIFQTILNDKRELKDKDALLHDDNDQTTTDLNQNAPLSVSNYSGLQHLNENLRSKSGDSWDKFNALLLKFLNNYMKQVKLTEEQRHLNDDMQSKDKRQSRRSSSSTSSSSSINSRSDQGDSKVPKVSPYEPSPGNQNDINYNIMMNSLPGEKNLLTFACLAQDGNPMNNLTFDWTFNSMSLPETEPAKSTPTFNPNTDNNVLDNLDNLLASNTDMRPVLIYSNENSTLSIQLIRRLDTRTTLNPFQMSLLTLNVIVNNESNRNHQPNHERPTRQANYKNAGNQMRAPVIKNRYQSFYNNLKSSNPTDTQHQPSLSNGAIHIAHEFDAAIKLPSNLELNEDNWQQQLGLLLKCTVSNHIGTSDSCPAAINLQERLARSGAQTGSSLYEFAKWRMPSLAQKSLLIISLMVSCMLILFATFALLIGPYLKSLQVAGAGKRQDSGGHCLKDDGTNTGQSTSSQKSSVLGLLGNGDSSLQASSDDDSSGRSNNHHLDHHLDHHQAVNLNGQESQAIANDNYDTRMNGGVMNRLDYDRPRSGRLIYQPGNLNEQLSSSDAYASGHYLQGNNNNQSTESGQSADSSQTKATAGGRLLASLRFKSLSTKFKVDRIADLPSITGRLGGPNQLSLHTKNMSNSETTTTGLSMNGLDTAGQTLASAAATATDHLRSSSYFGAPNLRHSHHFGRTTGRPSNYYMYRDSYGQQPNHEHQSMHLNSSSVYSNMMPTINDEPLNAMDEFLRRRGLATSTPAPVPTQYDYDSQSLSRNQAALSYSLVQQNQYKPRPKPPVHPRTTTTITSTRANPSSTMYRPIEVARTSIAPALQQHHHHHQQHLFSPSTLGRAALTQVGQQYADTNHGFQSYANDSMNAAASNRLDTIDSHLDRLAVDSLALGYYTNQMINNDNSLLHHQLAPPPSSDHQMAYANTLEIGSSAYNPNLYNHGQLLASSQNHQSAEHIYDVNAYATPEQTPMRRPNSIHNGGHLLQQPQQQHQQAPTLPESERPRVSQLIQSFNSQLSD